MVCSTSYSRNGAVGSSSQSLASLLNRVQLLTEAVVEPRLAEGRHRLLRQLGAMAMTGDLSDRHHPPDRRAGRLSFVLQALDGSLAGASQRDIAASTLGHRRAEADWTDPRGHIRDRVRRAVR